VLYLFMVRIMRTRTGLIGLKIEQDLKDKLDILAKKENRTKTYLLEQALRNFFKIKKMYNGKN